jgi:REP element-mobilizing transposase RayT
MPDHVHLLAAMTSRESLSSALRSWKSLCYTERHRRGNPSRFWQRSFFDRALRDDANVLDVAMYILGNPVRAGIVEDFHDYPLCGSMEFDL